MKQEIFGFPYIKKVKVRFEDYGPEDDEYFFQNSSKLSLFIGGDSESDEAEDEIIDEEPEIMEK